MWKTGWKIGVYSTEDIMSGESAISGSERPYTVGSFQNKLTQFQDLMKDITLQDVEATPEEKRQMITGKTRWDGREMGWGSRTSTSSEFSGFAQKSYIQPLGPESFFWTRNWKIHANYSLF